MLLPTVWDSSRRMIRRHAIVILIHPGGDGSHALIPPRGIIWMGTWRTWHSQRPSRWNHILDKSCKGTKLFRKSDSGLSNISAYFSDAKVPSNINGPFKVSFHMPHQTFTDQRTWLHLVLWCANFVEINNSYYEYLWYPLLQTGIHRSIKCHWEKRTFSLFG